MKTTQIARHMRRATEIRTQMGDHVSLWFEIRRPPGMKKYLFRRRIAKLRHHEEKAEELLEQGLRQYIARSIKD